MLVHYHRYYYVCCCLQEARPAGFVDYPLMSAADMQAQQRVKFVESQRKKASSPSSAPLVAQHSAADWRQLADELGYNTVLLFTNPSAATCSFCSEFKRQCLSRRVY